MKERLKQARNDEPMKQMKEKMKMDIVLKGVS